MTDGLPARRVAYAMLNDIFYQKKSFDEALSRHVRELEELEARDRAFARLLVSVVLKRGREMEAHLSTLLRDPVASLAPPQLLTIFCLGMAQLSFLQTPAHAAVDTCVELASAEGIAHQKPLVNAILRRLTREPYQPLPARDAGRMATPDWLWSEWMADYGVETALDIAAAHMDEPPVDFTLRDEAQTDAWAEKLGARLLPSGSLRKEVGGFIPDLDGFEEGAWWIQNAAAAIPAKLLGNLSGKKVIDVCAAPGGKTAQLVAAGAEVIALDRSAPRMQRLRENMTRLGMTVETVVADAAVWQTPQPFDAVLLDAPCSATGTIRHQPDVLWLKTRADQDKLAVLQQKLLRHAAGMVKSGGVIVYCTCSLQKAEGERQIDAFLTSPEGAEFSRLPIDENIYAEMRTPTGDLRILPTHWAVQGGMDGFFISRLVRAG